jgi:hypothetical protein
MTNVAVVPLAKLRLRNWRVAIVLLLLVAFLPLAAVTTKNCVEAEGAFSEAFSAGFDKTKTVCTQQALAVLMLKKIEGWIVLKGI